MPVGRYRLTVRYDGTDFHGSQEQPRRRRGEHDIAVRTVSGTLKAELERVVQQPVKLLWAGRTDAGVHANGNLCAFDADLVTGISSTLDQVRPRLPRDLWIVDAMETAADWHPRYAAVSRTYLYRIYTGRSPQYDNRRYVWHVPGLEVDEKILDCVQRLRELQDFGFAAKQTPLGQHGAKCTLLRLEVEQSDTEVRFWFEANRFLWRMVRNLVNMLVDLGNGKLNRNDVELIISSGHPERLKAAPACGLVLHSVQY
jgi:tRNA pseudouridine38-40 synthase